MDKNKKILVVGAGGFIAGYLIKKYQLDKPKGVRGRSSNNDLVKKILEWDYQIKLKDGLKKTYEWIYSEISKKGLNINKFTQP